METTEKINSKERINPEPPDVTVSEPQESPLDVTDSDESPPDAVALDLPPEPIRLRICPFRGADSQSTIVDESEEFPEPVDPWKRLAEDRERDRKRSFVELYLTECRKYGVTPLGYVRDVLGRVDAGPPEVVEVDLNRFGLSNLQTQIVLDCLAVACPDRLALVDLRYNLLMSVPMAEAVANLLQASQNIRELDLSHNRLSDDQVVAILAKALSTSSVWRLNLARCHISDAGGAVLFGELVLSEVREVDVSWNRLEHRSGVAAGSFLAGCPTVEVLNLEGNLLYVEKESIVPLLKQLTKNEGLKSLNLAWNALRGPLFGQALFKALTTCKLEVINLEMNCMRSEEAAFLLKILRKGESLREIYLGGNFFGEDDLKELVKFFGRNPNLKVLSLGRYQFVNKIAGRLSRRFMNRDPSKTISYQGVLMANPPRPVDVPEMLLDRCRFLGFKPKKKKLKRDLGHLMLQLQQLESAPLERDAFVAAVKKFRIKLDRPLLEALMDAFPTGKRQVDGAAMAVKYLGKYPTEPPPPKVKKAKKKKGKKGKKKKF
ncbi:leucine-rich repeat-containing protein 74B-like [Culex pipiens pallens]|uniref:leucine-rich repeat-containing protein 74B-like n=1 Tax=Culex pipiens pallens TaxID=42434 RepID=UPI00195415EA|nr:leucine-rich repeat-containing protein 74B-like [Culex pipiens pallens]